MFMFLLVFVLRSVAMHSQTRAVYAVASQGCNVKQLVVLLNLFVRSFIKFKYWRT